MTDVHPIIGSCIVILSEQQVVQHAELAELYRVATRGLVSAVKRNLQRFPLDFMFQLTADEVAV